MRELVVVAVLVFVTSNGVLVKRDDVVPVFDEDVLRVLVDEDEVVRDGNDEAVILFVTIEENVRIIVLVLLVDAVAVFVDMRENEVVGDPDGVRDTNAEREKVAEADVVFDVEDDADDVLEEVDERVDVVDPVPVGVGPVESEGNADTMGDGECRVDLDSPFEVNAVTVTSALDLVASIETLGLIVNLFVRLGLAETKLVALFVE